MSEMMLLSTLRLPVPDDPKELDAVAWFAIRQAMRDAADEIEARGFVLDDREAELEVVAGRLSKALVEGAKRREERDAALIALKVARDTLRKAAYLMDGVVISYARHKEALAQIDTVLGGDGV